MSQSQHAPERKSTASGPPSMPRWVKAFGIIFIILVLLAAVILITGIGGEHGPGRHNPSSGSSGILHAGITEGRKASGAGEEAALAGLTTRIEQGVEQPWQ